MAGRGNAVRERMVRAGLELFTERGFAAVSLIQVVERASAPRGSIYYHFPGGKRQLSIEVAASWRHTLEVAVGDLGERSDTAESLLEAYIDYFRRLMTSRDFTVGCPIVSLSSDVGEVGGEELRAAIAQTYTTIVDRLAVELMAKGIDRNRAPMIAGTVVPATQGALTMSRATRSTQPFDQLRAMVPSLFTEPTRS